MDIPVLDNPPHGSFRLLVIDGSELGPDLNGGRVVCINGSGDMPLSSYIIDPAMCSIEVPTITHLDVPIPAVPEPGSWVLLAVGMLLVVRRFHPAVLFGKEKTLPCPLTKR